MLAWTASSDSVGVVEYGLYASGVRVSTVSDANATLTNLACGTSYLITIDAADAAGNRSAQVSSFYHTSPCPSTDQPAPSTTAAPAPPSSAQAATASVKQTIANGATVASLVNWRAVYDRNGDGTEDDPGSIQFLVDGNQVLSEINPPFGDTFANGTITTSNGQHTFQVRALNDSGTLLATNTVTATIGSGTPPPPPPPPSSTGAVTQTIANGATVASLVNWRAVYDRNGDGTEDDPGSIQFLVDGNQVLSEINPPFGDTFANGTITTSNGQHTFQVRALNDSGTLLATNTVTATIGSGTPPPPPPPPSSTGAVTQTIANGATVASLVNWRAVYDRNGDGTEDDPGSIQFLVDGNQVLSEINPPFGDTFANGTITTSNGQHTFQVRALNDAGTLLATNTITATINNQTTPPADVTAPSQPGNLRVVSATASSATIAWNASTDNLGVTGYDIYRGGTKIDSVATTSYAVSELSCGTAYSVGIRAFDSAGNTSPQATLSITTSACADTKAPTAPTNVTVSTRTTTSIALTWAPSTDNIGVAGYGVYNGADLVDTTAGNTGIASGLTCGTNYTLAVDAFDATGNSSPKTTVMVATLPCTDTTAPTAAMTSPANGSTVTGTINPSANAADNVGVTRVEFFRDGVSLGSDASSPYSIAFNTTTIANGSHTFGARAYDSAGNVGNATNVTVTVSNTTPPPSSTGAVTQTIANGSTVASLVNWRAVYDRNGDGTEDDPGSIQFLVDGNQVLSEINPPFGDTFANGTITTSNGQHTFQVRALNDSGSLLATNTVTATVNNQTSPPPPSGSTACPLPAYPDASCTGVPPGTTLTPSGGLTLSTPGTVINALDITGNIVVNAPNVTIRNTRIHSNSMWVIDNNSTGLVVEDSEIINRPVSGQNNCHNGIGSNNFTVRRTEITGCENAANFGGDNIVFEDNYVHDLDNIGPSYVWGNGPHTDGIQMEPGSDNIVVRHNYIDPIGKTFGDGGTSAIIMGVNGSQNNVRIEDNYLDGRNSSYALYMPRQQSQGNVVSRNKMQRGTYGYTACVKLGVTTAEFNDNRDATTNALIAPDNGVGGGCSN